MAEPVARVGCLRFLPGFVLRLLVIIYPKADPRRCELLAVLNAAAWFAISRVGQLLGDVADETALGQAIGRYLLLTVLVVPSRPSYGPSVSCGRCVLVPGVR